MSDMFDDLKSIEEKSEILKEEKVAKFAYTDAAYADDDAVGVINYDVGAEQNIPKASRTDLDPFVIDKGIRTQAASLPRDAPNHYFGRVSYNLNKIVDWFYKIVMHIRRTFTKETIEYSPTAQYKKGDRCYIINTAGEKILFTRTTDSPTTITNLYPEDSRHWSCLPVEIVFGDVGWEDGLVVNMKQVEQSLINFAESKIEIGIPKVQCRIEGAIVPVVNALMNPVVGILPSDVLNTFASVASDTRLLGNNMTIDVLHATTNRKFVADVTEDPFVSNTPMTPTTIDFATPLLFLAASDSGHARRYMSLASQQSSEIASYLGDDSILVYMGNSNPRLSGVSSSLSITLKAPNVTTGVGYVYATWYVPVLDTDKFSALEQILGHVEIVLDPRRVGPYAGPGQYLSLGAVYICGKQVDFVEHEYPTGDDTNSFDVSVLSQKMNGTRFGDPDYEDPTLQYFAVGTFPRVSVVESKTRLYSDIAKRPRTDNVPRIPEVQRPNLVANPLFFLNNAGVLSSKTSFAANQQIRDNWYAGNSGAVCNVYFNALHIISGSVYQKIPYHALGSRDLGKLQYAVLSWRGSGILGRFGTVTAPDPSTAQFFPSGVKLDFFYPNLRQDAYIEFKKDMSTPSYINNVLMDVRLEHPSSNLELYKENLARSEYRTATATLPFSLSVGGSTPIDIPNILQGGDTSGSGFYGMIECIIGGSTVLGSAVKKGAVCSGSFGGIFYTTSENTHRSVSPLSSSTDPAFSVTFNNEQNPSVTIYNLTAYQVVGAVLVTMSGNF